MVSIDQQKKARKQNSGDWSASHNHPESGTDSWGTIGEIAPPKTYESNFIRHDFVQFGKQHSRYKAISPSIVLSQQCCGSIQHLSYSSEPVVRLDYQILLKSLPPNLAGWIRPCPECNVVPKAVVFSHSKRRAADGKRFRTGLKLLKAPAKYLLDL